MNKLLRTMLIVVATIVLLVLAAGVAVTLLIDPNQDKVWAPGEPGAVVTVSPPISPEQGPFYFNTQVVPDQSRSNTSKDGGVIVIQANPGTYIWEAHKEGLVFNSLLMTCIGGYLTNGSPPYGMQAKLP